jgi:putative transposase
MKRLRFTEEQTIAVLREQEAGMKTAEVCRKHGISDATFYKWKAKYGGLEVSEAKRLRALEIPFPNRNWTAAAFASVSPLTLRKCAPDNAEPATDANPNDPR